MLMKRETYLAPLEVRHSEDFKIVSFFMKTSLLVMWGNTVKNECLLLHSEPLLQIQ